MNNKAIIAVIITLIVILLIYLLITGDNDIESVKNTSLSYNIDNVESSWSEIEATKVLLEDNNIKVEGVEKDIDIEESNLIIKQAGIYNIIGTIANGSIIVDTEDTDDVRIILNGVNITNLTGPAIYVRNAERTIITLNNNTENYLNDSKEYVLENGEDEPDGTIFSKDTLIINGEGILNVEGKYKDGIVSKDELIIVEGNINVNTVGDGIRGKDYVVIKNGGFKIISGDDGIKSTNSDDAELGYILIENGKFEIISEKDGIQAETNLQIYDGNFVIKTGGGSENAPKILTENWGNVNSNRKEENTELNNQPNMGISPNSDSTVRPNQDRNFMRPDEMGNNRTNTNNENIASEGKVNNIEDEETVSLKGVKAGNEIIIKNGTFEINAQDDAIHSNNYILIENGNYVINTGDDGIHADTKLIVNGGNIDVQSCYEGIESAEIIINAGEIKILANDDGINVAGGSDGVLGNGRFGADSFSNSGNYKMEINGGNIFISSSGDGIDSNGSIYMNGGIVSIEGTTSGANFALDYDRNFELNGGEIMAVGSTQMAQSPSQDSTKPYIFVGCEEIQEAGTKIILSKNGKEIINYTPSKNYQVIVLAHPEIEKGESYSLYVGDKLYEINIEEIGTTVGTMQSNNMMNNRRGNSPTNIMQ